MNLYSRIKKTQSQWPHLIILRNIVIASTKNDSCILERILISDRNLGRWRTAVSVSEKPATTLSSIPHSCCIDHISRKIHCKNILFCRIAKGRGFLFNFFFLLLCLLGVSTYEPLAPFYPNKQSCSQVFLKEILLPCKVLAELQSSRLETIISDLGNSNGFFSFCVNEAS